jgi:hypothetical protein
MNGAQLKPPEFAYLLAILNAPAVLGVEDPALFPTKSSARDATYGQGRKDLEANGWLKPVPDHPDEYELNPILLEMVSVVAAPDFVVITSQSTGESEPSQVLHYLAGENIVELSVPAEETYQVGVVPDQETFHARIAEMLRLTAAQQPMQLTLDETIFEDIQSLSQKGDIKKAERLLDSSVGNGTDGRSLVAALTDAANGQIVVIRSHSGQVTSGRRASVFGEQDAAWLVKRTERDSSDLDITACDPDRISGLIVEWMDELTD